MIKMPNPNQEPPKSSKAQNQDLQDIEVFCKIGKEGVSKTSDHIQIQTKIQNPSQEPPASSKVPNQDLEDIDVFCIFKIKIESKNLDHGFIKDQ